MVEIVPANGRIDAFLLLVREYTDAIARQGSEVGETLSYQHLDEELSDAGKKYGPPDGRMYLALSDGAPAGCAALARCGEDGCEMKRLYVRPEFRGLRIGQALVERIIADARQIGYRHIRLDTFPFMKSAIRLYEKYGFAYIERYNDNPAETAVFMQLTL